MKKIAIAIGIERSGDLVPLPGAVAGARNFAQWASLEHETVLVTDERESVTLRAIFSAVKKAVEAEPDRLLIFFSGHGTASAMGDFWLLSEWQENGNEAVNLSLTFNHARRHSIGQIAVFADACRSTLPEAPFIGGGTIFPTARREVAIQPQWDQFLAARLGRIAQERRPTEGEPFGIFTRLLLNALTCKEIGATEQRVHPQRVISSRKLSSWLNQQLPLETGKLAGGSVQFPDIISTWGPENDYYSIWPSARSEHEARNTVRRRKLWPADIDPVVQTAVASARKHALESMKTISDRLLARPFPQSVDHRRLRAHKSASLITAVDLRWYREPQSLVFHALGCDGPAAIQVNEGRWVLFNAYQDLIGRLVFDDDGAVVLIQYRPHDETSPILNWGFHCGLVAKAWHGEYLDKGEGEAIVAIFGRQPPNDPALAALVAYHFERAGWTSQLSWRSPKRLVVDASLLRGDPLAQISEMPLLTNSWSFVPDDAGANERIAALKPGLVQSLWSTIRADFEPLLTKLIVEDG